VGTQPLAYHLRVSAIRVRVKRIFEMSFAIEMHTTGSRTVTKNEITSSAIAAMRGTDYHGPYYDQPHRHRSLVGGHNEGGIKPFSRDLKRVCWPPNFKSSGIEKYDGFTNPAEWLKVYQLTIEAI
jgi:hypothetical protein